MFFAVVIVDAVVVICGIVGIRVVVGYATV